MPVIVLGLCIILLAARLTIGVDLSDESYYAAFIDGWLKTGIEQSHNLMLHQTADFLVYPLALVFRALNGGADGLVLFLRVLYLAIAALASTALYRAVAPRYGRPMSTLVAACALLFVPFGLPAPSYNTIGMYSLLAALALFAMYFGRVAPQPERQGLPVLPWLSATSWAFACVAYPTMLAPLVLLLALGFAALKGQTDQYMLRRYLLACCAALALAAIALESTFGLSRLRDMVLFTNAFNGVSGGVVRKAQFAVSLFASHPRYAILLACAVIVAVIRGSSFHGLNRQWLNSFATAVIVVGVMAIDSPTLFMRSHDLVLVLSVAGVGEAFCTMLDSRNDRGARAFGIIYLVSVAAGLTSMITATNGPYNFPIGGLLSACLALLPSASTVAKGTRPVLSDPQISAAKPNLFVGAIACCAIGWSSFTFYYGQIGSPFYDMAVVRDGAFKGLRTDSQQALFINELTRAINSQGFCGNQMAVLGTGPGFYLMGALSPSALSTWNFSGNAENLAAAKTAAFYNEPKNRPDVLIVNNWQWATALSRADRELLSRYSIVRRVEVGLRAATVYRRADCKRDALGAPRY
ncbi:hypothetical protein [Caballeronia sordidicola]|uniref:Glycosyltransferase RgtA/B/C/D-like domain-containing protein n=1 Tax=Caballeronia sordidicola TaxID=196367 RepID=A0A242MA07_CABSO|nr:hypothetical protein [Caballeronia sordidicola]OTP67742.1 hypothetical protein PAMC26577_35760 [Caballeronia sordidicola]